FRLQFEFNPILVVIATLMRRRGSPSPQDPVIIGASGGSYPPLAAYSTTADRVSALPLAVSDNGPRQISYLYFDRLPGGSSIHSLLILPSCFGIALSRSATAAAKLYETGTLTTEVSGASGAKT